MPITDFIAALDEARRALAVTNGEIEALESARWGVLAAPPHADDIVAAFQRGLAASSEAFERQLGWHLNDTNATGPKAAAAIQTPGASMLALNAKQPEDARLFPNGPGLDLAAVTYFLRDRIAAEIPGLVKRLCPAAEQGMSAADRQKALREIDASIAELTVERDRLGAELSAARAAVRQ